MALASVAAGADGIIVEVHPDPERAKPFVALLASTNVRTPNIRRALG